MAEQQSEVETAATQATATSAATRAAAGEDRPDIEELFLYAFATQAEVIRRVRQQAEAAHPARIQDVLKAWSALQPKVKELVRRERGAADAVRSRPVPVSLQPQLDEVMAHPLFQKTFQHLPISFELVEVDALIAAQRTVNRTYAAQLAEQYPVSPSLDDLLRICVWPEREAEEPIRHLEARPNVHIFSSPVTDMRFLDSAARLVLPGDLGLAESGGLPTNAVLAFVGFGCSSINAFRVGRRIILNNGFHRVYALRSLGVKEIPIVVQHIHNVSLELPHDIVDLPSSYLLHHPRPVLVKDFFRLGFTLPLRVRRRLRVIKVTVEASRYDVPV